MFFDCLTGMFGRRRRGDDMSVAAMIAMSGASDRDEAECADDAASDAGSDAASDGGGAGSYDGSDAGAGFGGGGNDIGGGGGGFDGGFGGGARWRGRLLAVDALCAAAGYNGAKRRYSERGMAIWL